MSGVLLALWLAVAGWLYWSAPRWDWWLTAGVSWLVNETASEPAVIEEPAALVIPELDDGEALIRWRHACEWLDEVNDLAGSGNAADRAEQIVAAAAVAYYHEAYVR